MRITRLEARSVRLPLKEPYTIAYETMGVAENVLVRIDAADGRTGWGNAAPDPAVTGETAEGTARLLTEVFPSLLVGEDAFRINYLNHRLTEVAPDAPSARAAVNIALFDLLGKRAALSLFRLLGAYRDRILTSVTIGICPTEEAVRRAREYIREGFRALKIKGGRDWRADVERVRAVRGAVGDGVALRLDANQGYGVAEALRLIKALEKARLEFVEQPVKAEHLGSLQEVTVKSSIPIMADETVLSTKDSFRVAAHYHADHINIKLMKAGGITNAVKVNAVAEAGELETMVGCMDESVLSIAAGAHFAVAFRNVHYADLDGHLDLTEDPARGGVTIRDGYIIPADTPGLGVEVEW